MEFNINGVVFYLYSPEATGEAKEFNENDFKQYGEYWISNPYPSPNYLNSCSSYLYIDQNSRILLYFTHLPENKFTPEVEAIFNSIEIIK